MDLPFIAPCHQTPTSFISDFSIGAKVSLNKKSHEIGNKQAARLFYITTVSVSVDCFCALPQKFLNSLKRKQVFLSDKSFCLEN